MYSLSKAHLPSTEYRGRRRSLSFSHPEGSQTRGNTRLCRSLYQESIRIHSYKEYRVLLSLLCSPLLLCLLSLRSPNLLLPAVYLNKLCISVSRSLKLYPDLSLRTAIHLSIRVPSRDNKKLQKSTSRSILCTPSSVLSRTGTYKWREGSSMRPQTLHRNSHSLA